MARRTTATGAAAVPAGGQCSIAMPFNPRQVMVANGSDTASATVICLWIYPAVIAITPGAQSIGPRAQVLLQPPPPQADPNGDMFSVSTLVIYNNGPGGVTVTPSD